MYLVGLTGSIATGKSAVAVLFRERGIPVIDSDVIARQVVEPGTPAYCAIWRAFGSEYFHLRTEELDRKRLGAAVFADPEKRRILNKIVHPRIRKQILWEAFTYFLKGYAFVIVDVPLLFESKLNRYVHRVVTVFCDEHTQLSRLLKRDECSATEAEQRINSQMSLEQKLSKSDFLIDNNGSKSELVDQVDDVVKSLNDDTFHVKLRIGFLVVFTSISVIVLKGLSYFWS